jgi:hypothetical protein
LVGNITLRAFSTDGSGGAKCDTVVTWNKDKYIHGFTLTIEAEMGWLVTPITDIVKCSFTVIESSSPLKEGDTFRQQLHLHATFPPSKLVLIITGFIAIVVGMIVYRIVRPLN